jgi:hypothetical protein
MTSADGYGGIDPFQKCIMLAIWFLERNFYDPIPSVSFQLKDTAKKKNIPSKQCNGSNT